MQCPECKAEIDHVNVLSQCIQKAHLEGNKLVEYEHPDVLDTEIIECPECGANLTDMVEE